MSSMIIGSNNSHEKGSISTGPSTTKHGKASARSVEKQGPTFQRLNQHNSNSLNQTQNVHTMQTQISATKQSIAASSDNHPSHLSHPTTKTTKKSLMQKAVVNQQKHLLQNMNYQVVDQAFLSQLKSANVTVNGLNNKERCGRLAVSKTTKSTSGTTGSQQHGTRNEITGAGGHHSVNTGNNLFEFMSVQTASGANKGQSLGSASRHNLPGGQVSQSTRHAGKNFDRLNFSSTQGGSGNGFSSGGTGQMVALGQQHSSSSQRQQEKQFMMQGITQSTNGGNSRLMQYDHSNNRISQCTENESGSYHGQTSQLEPGNSIQGSTVMTAKNNTQINGQRSSLKSSERASKVGTANLKVQTQSGKPDFANLIRQPASTKNNVTKKQLEGQIISGIISKKTIAESLAKNQIQQKMLNSNNTGHISTKSGKAASGVTPAGYINEASLLMQAVSSQMQTPHNQGTKNSQQKNQIQNQFSLASSSKTGGGILHKRKASTQSNNNQVSSNPGSGQRISEHNFLAHEIKTGSKLNQFQTTTQAMQQKGGVAQRAIGNSNKNSAMKESSQYHQSNIGKKTTTSRSKPHAGNIVKLKLADTNQSSQEGHAGSGGPVMFENYGIQHTQPITATNQQRSQKMNGANQFSIQNKKSGVVTHSFVGKPSKSQERGNTHSSQHTGQKSVTNKYTKILAGVDDLDNNPPHNHVPAGISSATNKMKKSFNFDTAAIGGQHQDMNSIDNASMGHDTSAASRTRQELMNQIMLQQNQQLSGNNNNLGSPFNPQAGMKYLSTGDQPGQINQTSSSTIGAKQSQKQAKVQSMKTQQLLLLQQQYAQANSQANCGGSSTTNQASSIPTTFIRQSSLKQGNNGNQQQLSSGNTSRKVLFTQGGTGQKQYQVQQMQFASSGGKQVSMASSSGVNMVTKKITQNISGKVAKSVSQSKPPAHAQYFNSAKMKNDIAQASQGYGPMLNNSQIIAGTGGDNQPPNRTAITTGNGQTQIEVTGNQMLCLWNVNIGQGASANYIDQKGSFNLPYQMFQNTTNMMQQPSPQQHAFQQQQQQNLAANNTNNFYPAANQQQTASFHQQQQTNQQNQPPLRQSSSKESIPGQITSSSKTAKGRMSSKPQQQTVTRQIDINIQRKGQMTQNVQAQGDNEIGIFNKHFKRQVQTKVPLNIRTKKQMSSEAIMHQSQHSQPSQTVQSTKNNQTQNIITTKQITMSSKHNNNHDNNDEQQTTQTRLVKLIANTATAATHHSTNVQKQSDNPNFSQKQQQKSNTSRQKPKAQNSSSMEQRRSSNSRQIQSRGHSSKKQTMGGNQPPGMMLVTDNRELVEVAQQHMPRVNLSTTNKTTREINLNNLMDGQRGVMGTQQVKQLKQMGMLVNNYFGNDQHDPQNHHQQQMAPEQNQQHKRMQSLMTDTKIKMSDPQFITQMGLGHEQESIGVGQVQRLLGDSTGLSKQQYKGHTTKNTAGNPNLFNNQDLNNNKQHQQQNNNTSSNKGYNSTALPASSKQQQRQQQSQGNNQRQQPQNVVNKTNNKQQFQNQLENNHAVLTHNSAYIVNTGQNAPKAKKPPVAFNEEDLYDFQGGVGGEDGNEAWMQKMEAEWQQASEINRLIAKDEARLAVTSKGPLLSLQTANPLMQNQQKLKTQDVSEILRKAKQDFNNREAAAEPYEEDCVVEETDPDEIHYPKHEPAQLSSLHKNKASNLSQHTSSTMAKHQSPKHAENTDTLLKGAYLREQQAAQRQSQHGEKDVQQNSPEQEGVAVAIEEATIEYPMTVRQALKLYAKTGKLTDFEKTELLDFKKVYFLGLEAEKIKGKTSAKLHNSGYDDEHGDYNVILKDHIYYRFEVVDYLGKGSFGQALKCLDHKTGEIVALKIIKNKERYQHQAGVELRILQHLQKHDPDDQNNIIQIKDHCVFRNHLIISFELFSINLYEFIKNNNFQGVSLSLIRRFAIQILQSLKFLRDEDVIHCDLKPENILLKSPDKSGIKIIDFGSSCFSNQRIYSYIQSRFYRAPEIVIGIPYTTGIDMWSFGCILIELYTGIPIFPGESEMEQLALIMQVFGAPPLKVLENAERKDKFFRPGTNEPLHIIEDTDGSLRLPGSRPLYDIIGDQSETFFDFIVQCLAWDPEERISPLDALQHPWILEGLPRRVLIHHQRMLGLDVPSESSQASIPTDQPERNTLQDQQQLQYYADAAQFEQDEQQQIPTQISINEQDLAHQSSYMSPDGIGLANPFELANGDDYDDSNINQEMLDVHNRSTQQQQDQPQHLQLPARVIDNGMANQFQGQVEENNQNNAETAKPEKQEMSRTQPMPSQFLQGCKKASKQTNQQVNQNQNNHQEEQQQVAQYNEAAAQQNADNLNYQSLENGQQMLQFADMNQQFNNNNRNELVSDQMADFLGHEDLVDQEELQEAEQFNQKSKTTNMSSLLKQINQSIKKAGNKQQPSKYEIETEKIGAKDIPIITTGQTVGSTRYKLPQSTTFVHQRGAPETANADFNQAATGNQQEGASGNVSFLMKHRIRQAGGETVPGKKSMSSSTQGSSQRTTVAAISNHGNNKNVNKMPTNAQKEQEMMSDYAVAAPHHNGPHHPQAMLLTASSNRASSHGASKQAKSQRPQKMMMNNFLQPHEDNL